MRYVVATVESIPPGSRHHVEVGGRGVAIFNVGGEFFALRDACPHQGARLSCGSVVPAVHADGPGRYRLDRAQSFVKCPWHGWEYDLRTGQSSFDPLHDRVRAYEAGVASGQTLVAQSEEAGRLTGPYVVETVSVSVSGNYVIVDMGRGLASET